MPSATRTRVHGVIMAKPGVSFREIARVVELDETTVSYHVQKLKDESLVATEESGRERLCFSVGHGFCPVLRRAVPLLRQESPSRIVSTFGEAPKTCGEIFRQTGESERRIRTALGQLARAGLVEKTSQGRVQLVEGAQTCVRNARDATPCSLWGTCAVSERWVALQAAAAEQAESAPTSSPSPSARGAGRGRSSGRPPFPSWG